MPQVWYEFLSLKLFLETPPSQLEVSCTEFVGVPNQRLFHPGKEGRHGYLPEVRTCLQDWTLGSRGALS